MEKLNDHNRQERAVDIARILQMWDIDRDSALSIAERMVSLITATSVASWRNPLEGTGYVVPGNPRYKEENRIKKPDA